MSLAPTALYVHFPFCLSICPYCDFVVYAGRAARGPDAQIETFVDAVITEITLRGVAGPGLKSVYLGGGTPSLMSASQVAGVLDAVSVAFGIAEGAEITLEANPGAGERGDLAGFRAAGINRLSVGAQSLVPAELQRLGRRHSPADVSATVAAARTASFDSVSVDLLYDVPGQTISMWRDTLHGTIEMGVDHVSAYALALDGDPGSADHLPVSRGARQWRARARPEQDEDRAAELYEIADEALSAAGLSWYELSNWARPGRESRHNLTYWLGGAWEAVGPGAHAFNGLRTRHWNSARLDGYLAALAPADGSDPRLPDGDSETTDEETAGAEAAILRLRTSEGLQADLARPYAATLAWALANTLVEQVAEGGWRLTRRGRLLSNEVFSRLLPEPTSAAA